MLTRRSLVSVSALLCALSLAPAQERQRPSAGRPVGPRPDQTIFTELDLPTPDRMRTASGAPGADYWQQEANYAIEVSLDPRLRLVHGHAHVVYLNHSPDPLDYVWVHLEQNILRPDSISTLIGGGNAVGGPSAPSDGVRLLELRSAQGPLEYHVYDTMMRVEAPAPIAAQGGKFEFDVTWEFNVPTSVFRRYGTMDVKNGIVWEFAQWFPAVAVYDDVHGWNTLPYLGSGEFYTNFGNFDVRITVPHDHLVVATGVLQNAEQVYTPEQRERLDRARESADTIVVRSKEEVGDPKSRPPGDGPLTWHFHAEKVRTFAWASSEAFILDAASLGDTLLQSAYPEETAGAWSKSTQMLRAAIGGYNQRWFPYPYPVATNVSGVEGGMEYPMIIFCGGRNERSLYGVTTHEIGHTWFPMVVNTDERRHAWMDEGFNTFINGYSSADYFGEAAGNRARSQGRAMGRVATSFGSVPIMTEADQLNGMSLGMLQYYKTGNALRVLREYVLGEERFDYAFRTYIRRWAFKSPRPADFFRCMEDASGMDLDWFWRGWFVESATLDQAVDSVSQRAGRNARIVFSNLDRMVMPVTYEITFEDESTERHVLPVQAWFSSDRASVSVAATQPIVSVVVDPDRVLPDSDRENNTWKLEK